VLVKWLLSFSFMKVGALLVPLHCIHDTTSVVFGCFVLWVNQSFSGGVLGIEIPWYVVFGIVPSKVFRHSFHIQNDNISALVLPFFFSVCVVFSRFLS